MTNGDELDLGACCNCGLRGAEVRNVMMLEFTAPIPGKGWGCAVCSLPADGAVAVLCDACFELVRRGETAIYFVCVGYPGENQRMPHDQAKAAAQPFHHHPAPHMNRDSWKMLAVVKTHGGIDAQSVRRTYKLEALERLRRLHLIERADNTWLITPAGEKLLAERAAAK